MVLFSCKMKGKCTYFKKFLLIFPLISFPLILEMRYKISRIKNDLISGLKKKWQTKQVYPPFKCNHSQTVRLCLKK